MRIKRYVFIYTIICIDIQHHGDGFGDDTMLEMTWLVEMLKKLHQTVHQKLSDPLEGNRSGAGVCD